VVAARGLIARSRQARFAIRARPFSKTMQAISHYTNALGDPAGLIELVVFYSEQASGC
jgi:hypothetical protein